MAPTERAQEPADVRDAGPARRGDRARRRSDPTDFAAELTAAREAASREAASAANRVERRRDSGTSELEATGGLERSDRTRDVGAVSRELEALDPALRAALERVIARMRAEYGHEVTLVEGVRSPERQAALYAQGRTTPGPVVTWTIASRHLTGRAADLMVDGGWTNMEGYERLQRIAAEEGLQVLGMRDPGHVELPEGRGASRPWQSAAHASDVASRVAQRPAGLAQVARVAEVASVARVAEPAAVARPAAVAQVAAVAVPGAAARLHTAGGDARGESGAQRDGGARREAAPVVADANAGERPTVLALAPESGGTLARLAEVRAAESVNGADPLAHIARVEQVKEAAGPRAPTVLTLRVDDGMGGEDRIRLDLRGSSLGATMDVRDAGLAERLGSTVNELRRALEQRGLTADRLQVRVSGAEVSEGARVAAATLDRDAARFSSSQHTPQRNPDESPAGERHAHPERRDAHDPHSDRQRRDARRQA